MFILRHRNDFIVVIIIIVEATCSTFSYLLAHLVYFLPILVSFIFLFCCDPTSAVHGVLDICRQTIAINTISDLTSAYLSNIAKQQDRWTGCSTFHSNKGENRTWECQWKLRIRKVGQSVTRGFQESCWFITSAIQLVNEKDTYAAEM